MKILIINGPNLNLLGLREPQHYGKETYADLVRFIQKTAEEEGMEVGFYQSNHEGDLVDKIQEAYGKYDGIVMNAGAYTHTSIAILDALKAVSLPCVEVHISDVAKREDFRQISYMRMACIATYSGLGFEGYRQGMLRIREYVEGLQQQEQ